MRGQMEQECGKSLQLAEEMVRHYRQRIGVDYSLRLLQRSENMTYLVEYGARAGAAGDSSLSKPGGRVILRLSRPGYHTEEELRAEIAWMRRLRKDFPFCIRQPVAGDDGEYLYRLEAAVGRTCYGTVFTYLSGRPLEELPFREQAVWFRRLGEATALLHKQTEEWPESRRLPRIRWDYETMVGRRAVWGDWRCVAAQAGLAEERVNSLRRADRLIDEKLQAYGKRENRYGLIHGDLRGANLLIEGDCLRIIDFDDCGYGWYLQDLAASLSFIETEEIVPELIRAWIIGYRQQRSLTEEDVEMISTFIMMRRLQLLAWIHSRAEAAPAIAYGEQFLEGTVMLAERYLAKFHCADAYYPI